MQEMTFSTLLAMSYRHLPTQVIESKYTVEITEVWLKENPFQYDNHASLIRKLKETGDIDETRKAREKMADLFPLTEELWLDWFKDEMHLIALPAQKAYVEELFEKAVKDYMSVRVWIQFCQLAMDDIQSSSGIDHVRSIFERAVTSVGLHLTEGSSIWDSYREFENEILLSYQTLYSPETSTISSAQIEEQIHRVDSLFRRQLAVPLLGMEKTMQDYEDWTTEPMNDALDKSYKKALSKLEQCLPFEDSLSTAPMPKLAEYRSYIEHETKDGDPARIQCIYERAIKDNCLDASLWRDYTDYLDNRLKVPNVALPIHERAVRNCPWIGSLWVNYMKAMVRCKKTQSEIKDTLQKALGCGFTASKDYLDLWLTYCDCMKQRILSWEEDKEIVVELRKSFEDGVNYMDHYFGNEGDRTCLLRRYWAIVEAKFLNNIPKAIELWDAVIKLHSRETHIWLEYTNFLRLCGDTVSCRRAFQRAVQTNVDNPEQLCEAFLLFERVVGTPEQLGSATQKCEMLLKKMESKRAKDAERDAEKAAENEAKKEKQKQAKMLKNKQNKKLGKQQRLEEGQELKKDSNKDDIKKRKLQLENINNERLEEPLSKKLKDEPMSGEPSFSDGKSLSVEIEEQKDAFHKEPQINDESKERTVFLSNLLFTTDEDHIKNLFLSCGAISQVRIVRNAAGRSKGYAYLEFSSKTSTEKALGMDRTMLDGRPVFVSPCLDKVKNQQPQFRFALSLDKQTVFVTNLPFETTKEELVEIFSKAGSVKEVRIVTNRSGKPKGYAYIEYLDEHSASNAVLQLDGQMIKERQVNVAISKAPPRKEKSAVSDRRPEMHAPVQYGSRGRAKTQLAMIPRAIHASKTQTDKVETKNEEVSKSATSKMSNDDFRKMLSR